MLPPSDGAGYVMNLSIFFKRNGSNNFNKLKIYAALVVALLTGSDNSPLADLIGVTSSTSRARKGSKDSTSSRSWSNIEPDWNSIHEKQSSGSWLVEGRTMKQRLPKTDRIVGGTPAIVDTNNNGFMVALYYDAERFICGGSLITPTVVLTAAHCAPYVAFGRIHINNKYGSQEEEGYEQFDVTDVITHPQYNSTLKRMDYALLKLNGWSKVGSTISLNNVSDIPAEQDRVTVLGWGTTSEGGLESKTLLSATLNYVPFNECWEAYKHKNVITPSVICAGVKEGGKDACQGDSGGPLILAPKSNSNNLDRSNTDNILVGVVSFGYGCARPGIPGVYQRVSSAINWIKKTACELHSRNKFGLGSNSNSNSNGENCPIRILSEYARENIAVTNPETKYDVSRLSDSSTISSSSITPLPIVDRTWKPKKTAVLPTERPTAISVDPTVSPKTTNPTQIPITPIVKPTDVPSDPTAPPKTAKPTQIPITPTPEPTSVPIDPTAPPKTARPTQTPITPTPEPTSTKPKQLPTFIPSLSPSNKPTATALPSINPSTLPSNKPSSTVSPSSNPSQYPSSKPTLLPSKNPSLFPSTKPSFKPSKKPTHKPSVEPSGTPSRKPSKEPSSKPSAKPSRKPSTVPSSKPSTYPSKNPSKKPSSEPSSKPSRNPTSNPSTKPKSEPSKKPSWKTSDKPSPKPLEP